MAILHIPHSAVRIPPSLRADFLISDQQLRRELLRMTDLYTDELFCGSDRLVFPVSRLVCDVERFPDPAMESMTRLGMWICYQNGSDLLPIKRLRQGTVRRVLSAYYQPHHRQLADRTAQQLAQRKSCLIVDCHSFPSHALPYEDAAKLRPDLCIGTDAFHTPPHLVERVNRIAKAYGLRAACNTPYAGTLVPLCYYRKNRHVTGIMIEVNRSLYMDEATGEKLPQFAQTRAMLDAVLAALEEA